MPLLVLIFIVVPILELYVIIQVGGAIGVLPTIAILLADALLGAFLLRHLGRAVWLRFNRALNEGRVPHREVIDGVLVIFGGALLLTPGFITDVFGLILLIPPTRALVRGLSLRLLPGRIAMSARAANWGYDRFRGRRAGPAPASGWPPPGGPGPTGPTGPRPGDIEGTAHEIRDEEGRLVQPPDREDPAPGAGGREPG